MNYVFEDAHIKLCIIDSSSEFKSSKILLYICIYLQILKFKSVQKNIYKHIFNLSKKKTSSLKKHSEFLDKIKRETSQQKWY